MSHVVTPTVDVSTTARWRWDTTTRRLVIDAHAHLQVSREDLRALLQQDIASVLHRRAAHFHHEHVLVGLDGSVRATVRGTVWAVGHGALSVAGLVVFAPERATPRHSPDDQLTGLASRERFVQALARRGAEQGPAARPYAVLCLDLDNLQAINDGLGPAVGDLMLRWAADRIRDTLPGALASRIGSDEFAVLLEAGPDDRDLDALAHHLLTELSAAVSLDGHLVYPTAKAGLAWSETTDEGGETVLRDAQSALARAKRQRNRRIVSFNRGMRAEHVAALELDRDLRQAIATDTLQLHFQPIVQLTDGRAMGFEALLRWHHPERGWVSPGEFVPQAERTGLILPVGRWVLHEACQAMVRLRASHASLAHAYVTVNLSPLQLHQADLVAQVRQALSTAGLSAQALRLELTENTLMADTESTLDVLHALRELGVQILIDDFGTGFSSLNYLARLPADVLKVDRSFVDGLGQDARKTRVVRTIVDLARSLGLGLVAEGVETRDQLLWLRRLGVGTGQGYLFGRPVPEAEVAHFAARDLSSGVA